MVTGPPSEMANEGEATQVSPKSAKEAEKEIDIDTADLQSESQGAAVIRKKRKRRKKKGAQKQVPLGIKPTKGSVDAIGEENRVPLLADAGHDDTISRDFEETQIGRSPYLEDDEEADEETQTFVPPQPDQLES